jgi:hypothetical protein
MNDRRSIDVAKPMTVRRTATRASHEWLFVPAGIFCFTTMTFYHQSGKCGLQTAGR